MDDIDWFMRILNDVARIHPFVAGELGWLPEYFLRLTPASSHIGIQSRVWHGKNKKRERQKDHIIVRCHERYDCRPRPVSSPESIHLQYLIPCSRLKDIRDPNHIGPDGRTIEARMQTLAIQATVDIKDCANACDTYSKKKLLVKVLKGPIWEGQLAEFFGRFQRCRSEFEFALAIHTASVTDCIKSTVESVDAK